MSKFKFKQNAGSFALIIDTFGEDVALDGTSAEPSQRPPEVPEAAEREGLYEVRQSGACTSSTTTSGMT